MRLRIILEKDFGSLEIGPGNRTIDSEKFLYYYDLDEKLTPLQANYFRKHGYIKRDKVYVYGELVTGLISAIDKLLTRNNVDIADIVDFNIVSSLGPESSSHKIAEAFVCGIKMSI